MGVLGLSTERISKKDPTPSDKKFVDTILKKFWKRIKTITGGSFSNFYSKQNWSFQVAYAHDYCIETKNKTYLTDTVSDEWIYSVTILVPTSHLTN